MKVAELNECDPIFGGTSLHDALHRQFSSDIVMNLYVQLRLDWVAPTSLREPSADRLFLESEPGRDKLVTLASFTSPALPSARSNSDQGS